MQRSLDRFRFRPPIGQPASQPPSQPASQPISRPAVWRNVKMGLLWENSSNCACRSIRSFSRLTVLARKVAGRRMPKLCRDEMLWPRLGRV
ncbi:unnamed protein product [Protopolystoma xenopodis]|uniref:Uncharacterized protein n=1 Tax=Protopolystoma xenopodis TaxID=117903 RepID=A0A448XAP3_9PLAT|nr:unnamed protein product [Protopolystoma xenopodis]